MILAAFRVRSFRFQWAGDLLTSWAFEMETIVLGWYVMVNTGSVLLLTVFASMQYVGTLAAPLFGVMGDRLGGRTMLCAMRTCYATLAAVLGILAVTGLLTPGWVFAISALAGLVRPSDLVMRNSLVAETIPPGHLMSALGLSRITSDSARIAGALAGAALSTTLGLSWTYLLLTIFYVGSLGLTLGVARRSVATGPAPLRPRAAGWSDLRDGMVRVFRTPALAALILLAILVNLTVYPVSNGLLPYVARQVYRTDATGLGWLAASFAGGGLVGSLATVLSGRPRHPARATLVGIGAWCVTLVVLGQVANLGAGIAILLVAGFAQNVAMIAMTAGLLTGAGAAYRARVMGVRIMAVQALPLGLLAFGVLIERVGYPATVSLAAALGLGLTGLIAFRWRASLWRVAS